MVNLIIDIDKQLENKGWKKSHENMLGFGFVKKIGSDVFYIAQGSKVGIRFYDSDILDRAVYVDEEDLDLFRAKLKRWRKQYGNYTETGNDPGEKLQ